MIRLLCLAAGMLYWGCLVFKTAPQELWGRCYWMLCAAVAGTSVLLAGHEALSSVLKILSSKEEAAARLERTAENADPTST